MRHVERPAAEEILQEVCVTLWRYASRFDSEQGTLRSWLLRMVRWKVLNELRHRRHQPRLVADEFELKEPLHYVADEEPGPDERAIQVERDHLVQSALAALPPKERQAVSLAFLGNLTHQEVAATLNLPLGTAKTRIRSGLEKMRLHLAPLAGSLPALAGW
jgi:RNA polymerase sigma-70 factor (ECF subfamily)